MPQVRTKSHIKTHEATASKRSTQPQPNPGDAHGLISKMLEYEAAAHKQGINLSSGRFEMLTASERQFYRAELVADYIRLSAGNLGNTQCYFDSALAAFCDKICDMNIPSHELIGTYLAAVDLVSKEDKLIDMPALKDAVKNTMMQVLQSCVSEMAHRADLAA